MIVTEFYDGQGLGNQLWCYVTLRVIALNRGYDFGIVAPDKFKGRNFMSIDFGKPASGIQRTYIEKSIIHPWNGADIRLYDHDLMTVPDNTQIVGYMQDELYINHYKDQIRTWFNINPENDSYDFSAEDLCVINFRGREYIYDKDLFLSAGYWEHAVANMRTINPKMRFIVITDDTVVAKKIFPDFDAIHFSTEKDYCIIKNAYYLILSNSSFAWFPAWLSSKLRYCIAPKYWGRHNISDGFWSLGYNITTGWMYQDRRGDLHDYETCKAELDLYIKHNPTIFNTKDIQPSFWKSLFNKIHIFFVLSKDVPWLKAAFSVTIISLIGLIKRLKIGRKLLSHTRNLITGINYY